MKLLKGNFYRFNVKGFKETINGIYCSKGQDYIMLLNVQVDYMVDGILYLPINNISLADKVAWDSFTNKVLKSRKVSLPVENAENLTALFLKFIKSQELVAIQEYKENAIYVGRIYDVEEGCLYINSIGTKAQRTEAMLFKIKDIKTIEIKSDYLQALEAYSKKYKKKK